MRATHNAWLLCTFRFNPNECIIMSATHTGVGWRPCQICWSLGSHVSLGTWTTVSTEIPGTEPVGQNRGYVKPGMCQSYINWPRVDTIFYLFLLIEGDPSNAIFESNLMQCWLWHKMNVLDVFLPDIAPFCSWSNLGMTKPRITCFHTLVTATPGVLWGALHRCVHITLRYNSRLGTLDLRIFGVVFSWRRPWWRSIDLNIASTRWIQSFVQYSG